MDATPHFVINNPQSELAQQLEHLQIKLGKALRGFEGGFPPGVSEWDLSAHNPDLDMFPVPELVLFALRDVMGFRWTGPGEKVRWIVHATVEGEPFGFALRKQGFRILRRHGLKPELLRRVSGQLSSSLRLLEPFLKMVAEAQISEGNLTLANKMALHEDRYRYFRKLADQSFARTEDEPVGPTLNAEGAPDIIASIFDGVKWQIEAEQEGFFASGAMVEAWFSGLEHRLLLLRAFIGRPLPSGGFKAFLAEGWDDRLRILVREAGSTLNSGLMGRLRRVKETIRNPLSHGGSFHFHLPRVGAIPANLSRYRGRVRMSFFPISPTSHNETCVVFDEVDALLSTGHFELPHQFVRWGVEPQFHQAGLERYAIALAGGAKSVEELLDRIGYEMDRHDNMDY